MTTAGRLMLRVSSPPSISRVTSAVPSLNTISDAKVACGQPSSAASICPVWLLSSSMACLPRMTMPGLLLVRDHLEQARHGEGLQLFFGDDVDGAVRAHGERGAQRLLRLLGTGGDGDDLVCVAGLLHPHRFLDGDLAEGVHRHLDVRGLDPGPVGLHPHLHVGIDRALDRDQDLHGHSRWADRQDHRRVCADLPPRAAAHYDRPERLSTPAHEKLSPFSRLAGRCRPSRVEMAPFRLDGRDVNASIGRVFVVDRLRPRAQRVPVLGRPRFLALGRSLRGRAVSIRSGRLTASSPTNRSSK